MLHGILYRHPERHGQVPTLLFVAGNDDHYVDSQKVLEWGKRSMGGCGLKAIREEFHAWHWGQHLTAVESKISRFILAVLAQQSEATSLEQTLGVPGVSEH
jgi:hypothetical protein